MKHESRDGRTEGRREEWVQAHARTSENSLSEPPQEEREWGPKSSGEEEREELHRRAAAAAESCSSHDDHHEYGNDGDSFKKKEGRMN